MQVFKLLNAPMKPTHQEYPQRETMGHNQHIGRVVFIFKIAIQAFQKRADAIVNICARLPIRDALVKRAELIPLMDDVLVDIRRAQMPPVLFAQAWVFAERNRVFSQAFLDGLPGHTCTVVR